MTADQTQPPDQQAPAWMRRADRPAGVFASYAGPVRERVRISRRSMISIYVVLLSVTAIFGVFAAYQWERAKDAAEQAELIADQNMVLARRIKDLESRQRLPELVPEQARQEQAQQEQPQFETASGSDPTMPLPAAPSEPAAEATPEPAPQDQAKADQVAPEQEPSSPADGALDVARAEPVEAAEIVIVAREETWIQIVDAGGTALYTRLMKPGERYTMSAVPGATLVTGNPSGLTLSVDGRAAPAFNPKGPTRREIALDPRRLMDGTAERR